MGENHHANVKPNVSRERILRSEHHKCLAVFNVLREIEAEGALWMGDASDLHKFGRSLGSGGGFD